MRTTAACLAITALLAMLLGGPDVGADPAGDPSGPTMFRIPAGSYRTLSWEPAMPGFVELWDTEAIEPSTARPRVPAWLRTDVEEQLDRLERAPLRVDGGRAGLGFVDVTGDGVADLLARNETGEFAVWAGPGWDRLNQVSLGRLPGEWPETKGPVLADVNGDGLPDEVFCDEDGLIRWRRARGMPGAPVRLRFAREPRRWFPFSVGAASRPSCYGDHWALGNLDGDVSRVGRDFIGSWFMWGGEEHRWIHPSPPGTYGRFTAPALGKLLPGGALGVVLGTESGRLVTLVPGDDWEFIRSDLTDGLSVGACASPCLVDLDGDGSMDLLCGNRDGKILLFRGTGEPTAPKFVADTSDERLAAIDVGESSAPTAGDVDGDGDVDLIVGNQAGELRLFLGPDWKEDPRPFAGLDVGELAAPALYLDSAGKVVLPLGLVVGRLEGDFLFYRGERTPDGVTFTESLSWSFTPEQNAKTIEDYYRRNFFAEAEELRGRIDVETRKAYEKLLADAPDHLVDEIAFAVAHTPAEVLRAMHRLGQSSLLLENAKAVYDMASRVAYANIVEKPDGTTLAYARGPGDWVEAPRDVYYWWVVHPRLLFEIPCRVDATWWETSAKERGMKDSPWWKHEPETAIQAPSEHGVFWRPALAEDDRFGSKLVDRAAGAKTLREAITAVSQWVSHGPGLMRFGYETQDLQPWLIYAKHYGSCGEHSIIGAAAARTMLVPTAIVGCRGEDHQWNEWWDTDGEWHQWDACNGRTDNPYYEGRQHQGKTISTVSRWWGNDRLDATTTTVFNPPDDGYTKTGRGYTDAADITVTVVDAAKRPIDGAIVVVRSHWENRNLVSMWGHTDGRGRATFALGFEPHGGYTIETLTPFGSAGVRSYVVDEARDASLVLEVPGEIPEGLRLTHVTEADPPLPKPTDTLTARIRRARIRPPSPLTASRYRIGSYMTDAHGYAGTRGFPVDVDPGDRPEILVFTPDEFAKFERAETCKPLHRAGFDANGVANFPFPRDRSHVIVLSNVRSVWTEVTVEVETQPGGPDRVAPVVTLAGDAKAPRGTVVVLEGTVTDDIALASLRLHCSVWPDEKSLDVPWDEKTGTFRIELDTGAGGPWPAGSHGVIVVARDTSGNETRSDPAFVTLEPARRFLAQKIRQDDPDDPLAGDVWTYGPFDLDGTDRFLLIRTNSLDEGFDCDVHLYRDKNGNGRLDGKHEVVKSSTSPTATERIYIEKPPAGTYWLRCQGWQVKGEFARLDVDIFPTGTARAIVDLAPAGRLASAPPRLRAAFLPFARIDAASVRVTLDGRDVTRDCRIDRTGLETALPPGLQSDSKHEIVIRARRADGIVETRTVSFTVDTIAPAIEVLAPKAGAEANGKLRVEVEVRDEAKKIDVTARVADGKERRLKRVKERPGVFFLEIDASEWPAGERFIWVKARDGVGNESERVVPVRAKGGE